jgi:ribonuclease HI
MSKYYAVAVGRAPGIYTSWEEGAQPQVNKYPGAKFKSFSTFDDAKMYLEINEPVKRVYNDQKTKPGSPGKKIGLSLTQVPQINIIPLINTTIAFTDGSGEGGGFGYGGVIIPPDGKIIKYSEPLPKTQELTGTSNQCELYAIYHVLSEVKGNLIIYSDSMYSINCLTVWYKKWDQTGWRDVCNTSLIKNCLELMKGREVSLEYVAAHTGQVCNEMADILAKNGAKKYKSVNECK